MWVRPGSPAWQCRRNSLTRDPLPRVAEQSAAPFLAPAEAGCPAGRRNDERSVVPHRRIFLRRRRSRPAPHTAGAAPSALPLTSAPTDPPRHVCTLSQICSFTGLAFHGPGLSPASPFMGPSFMGLTFNGTASDPYATPQSKPPPQGLRRGFCNGAEWRSADRMLVGDHRGMSAVLRPQTRAD
jgi:hypothetical protein